MAKIKIKNKSKSQDKKAPKTIKIKKPEVKLPDIKVPKFNIKFSKPNFKNLFSGKFFRVFLYILAGVTAFILVDLFVQYLNNDYSVAVINGNRITKNTYHKRLESSYGTTIAQQLIDEEIIRLEAKKAEISVSQEDIDTRLNEIIESIGGEEAYQTALKANNITEADLIAQIELDIISTKIIEPTLEYTDDDIKAFFDQYSSVIFPNETSALEEGEKLSYDQYKDQTKEVFIQQQVENNKYTWLESLKGEYNIQDNSASKPKYGVLSATINIFKNMFNEANTNTTDETTETTE